MRFERWSWLIVFLLISSGIHAVVGYGTRGFGLGKGTSAVRQEIEVTLAPAPIARPVPKPVKPKPKPVQPKPVIVKKTIPTKMPADNREQHPSYVAHKNIPVVRNAQPVIASVRLSPLAEKNSLAPIKVVKESTAIADAEKLQNETPTALAIPNPPIGPAPRLVSASRNLTVQRETSTGGSVATNASLTGKGGTPGPEAPPEDTLFTGGGAGGQKLPKAPAKLGGGGGKSILSVDNPLAKEAVPEDKPGIGAGTGGGAGTGSGGGAGFRQGKGIGTRGDGRDALATLNSKPGNGIGAGQGNKTGTQAPGGGKGTGAETPGTGGDGAGYGRGRGIDLGNATAPGEVGLSRGIPFGDLTSKLAGARPSGPPSGTPARGGVFGQTPTVTGNGGAIHIIYLLDTSGSMIQGGKIFKAKLALSKAIIELRSTDTFNIINFDDRAHPMAAAMIPATKSNVKEALAFIDSLRLRPHTNVSDAIEMAFTDPTITHMFLLSDGEPNAGISKFRELRQFIIQCNTHHIQINTLALGLGEDFDGIRLLKGIAQDNDGQFSYINLLKEQAEKGR